VKIPKKRLQRAVVQFRRQFGDQPTRAMGAVLAADVVAAAVKEEVGEFRQRLYPPLTALGLFMGQALSPDGACQDAVARNLSDRRARGESGCSLSTGPYCKARQRLPLGLINRLGVAVGATLEQASPRDWKWRGRSVKLMDGTTVSMPDTPANQSVYPQSGGQQPGLGFPLAMLVGLMFRGVAFEFRMKALGWHRELWNWLFWAGSFLASFSQGFMLGRYITGFEPGAGFLLFAMIVGASVCGGYVLLGDPAAQVRGPRTPA